MGNWATEAELLKYLHRNSSDSSSEASPSSRSAPAEVLRKFTPQRVAKGVLYDAKYMDSGFESVNAALRVAATNDERRAGYFTHPNLGRCWRWPYLIITALDPGPPAIVKCAGAIHPPMRLQPLPPHDTTAVVPKLSLVAGQFESSMPQLAMFLGKYMAALHDLSRTRSSPLVAAARHAPADAVSPPPWLSFEHFLLRQRQKAVWTQQQSGKLSKAQLAQLDQYLPRDPRDLVPAMLRDPTRGPCCLHGDLNEDHLLVQPAPAPAPSSSSLTSTTVTPTPSGSGGGSTVTCAVPQHQQEQEEQQERMQSVEHAEWEPVGVIDYGDAQTGDPHYDLVALHISLFKCDPILFGAFLEAYTAAFEQPEHSPLLYRRDPSRFRHILMCYTLLHRQDALRSVFLYHHDWRGLDSLTALEERIWSWQVAGLLTCS